uniref:Uncharacterized protein n=1 Tax=Timema douglasi TaxID=61478 RepID=A0A7R8VL63_TIMDO|nr:unnamed protein product [Timema douglasi]
MRSTSLANLSLAVRGSWLPPMYLLKGTNCTMSRAARFLPDLRAIVSASSVSIAEKSASPIPTMITDSGSTDASTNHSVGEDQEDKVAGTILERRRKSCHVVDDWRKIIRVGGVHVDEELMRNASVRGQPGSKTQNREHLVGVVILDNLTDRFDSLLVLVGYHADVVERAGISHIPNTAMNVEKNLRKKNNDLGEKGGRSGLVHITGSGRGKVVMCGHKPNSILLFFNTDHGSNQGGEGGAERDVSGIGGGEWRKPKRRCIFRTSRLSCTQDSSQADEVLKHKERVRFTEPPPVLLIQVMTTEFQVDLILQRCQFLCDHND